MKIKQHFIDAKNLVQRVWKYKLVVLCLALLLANVLQEFPVTLPTYAVAYEKENISKVDLETLVEERAVEIHNTMKKEARYKAMRMVYEELGLMVTAEYETFE